MAPSVGSEGPSSRAVITRRVSRVILVILTVALVIAFGVNRPELIHRYYTDNFSDNICDKLKFTCGCTSQRAGALRPGEWTNCCYKKTEVGNKDVIRFPQFSGPQKILKILEDTYPFYRDDNLWRNRSVPGLQVTLQGPYISSNNDSFLKNFKDLFLTDPQEWKRSVSVAFLESRGFTEFPSSYMATSFTFTCTNCTLCPISSVHEILKGFGTTDQPWGDCHYWGRKNHCENGSNQQFYEAKCVVYPKVTIPFNFALIKFLRKLQDMPGIDELNEVSFDTNKVYMNFSRLVEGPFDLNFFEVARTSSAFSRLVELYPGFARPCDENVHVCNSTSVCNVFKNSQEDGYEVKCSAVKEKSECQRDLDVNDPSYINVTVDAADNFGDDFRDFSALICMNGSCQTRPSHELFWDTVPLEENNSLNSLLSSFWNEQLSICTMKYTQVTQERFNVKGFGNMPSYLETVCSRRPNITSPGPPRGICHLTGKFNKIVDLPHELKLKLPLPDSVMFKCTAVSKQGFFLWLIVSFGIVFGWLGSMDMLFSWILYPLTLQLIQRLKRCAGKKMDVVPTNGEARIVDVENSKEGSGNGNQPTGNLCQRSLAKNSRRSMSNKRF